jgi:hypothetical protein
MSIPNQATNTGQSTTNPSRSRAAREPKKKMSRGGKMIVEIETLPYPEGNARNKYHNVEEAISIVEKSGLKYEVSPLCTTMEGALPPSAPFCLCVKRWRVSRVEREG